MPSCSCRLRTPRNTAQNKAAGTARRCSTSSYGRRSSLGSMTSMHCAKRSPKVGLLCGTSPRWICGRVFSSAPRRSRRWDHPERGILEAEKFVPLAEETGLVLELDDAIVRSAVTTRAELSGTGLVDGFRIWCNVSATRLTRGKPAEQLARLFERTGCDPNLIGLELTETGVLGDVVAAAREIAAVRELGVKVALDDFGTGHSSLTLLRSLTIDRVKIDRTFISEFTRDSRDAAIVRRVIALAHDLGLDVVAEGVETPGQARL